MATGLFLLIEQLTTRVAALESEVQPGAPTPVTQQISGLQSDVTALQALVGQPDAATASPAPATAS